MGVEIAICPVCRQKLALNQYTMVGSQVVCANRDCGTSLRVVQLRPPIVEVVPVKETFHPDYRPESYG